MKSFTIKKLDQDLEIENFKLTIDGFIYKSKNKNYKVKELVIVNPEIISALVSFSFYKNYKRILEKYLLALKEDDDSTEGNLLIALDEIARLKSIILEKYRNYLKKKEITKFFKQLEILEEEIKNKIVDIKLIKVEMLANTNIVEENRGKGR
ncbi:MAG: hypothetical protein NC483_03070 [Ruminococcus sp.]|nr:hypothetical protein [Ruminococcus sp.]